jgi:hypothetical protein
MNNWEALLPVILLLSENIYYKIYLNYMWIFKVISSTRFFVFKILKYYITLEFLLRFQSSGRIFRTPWYIPCEWE